MRFTMFSRLSLSAAVTAAALLTSSTPSPAAPLRRDLASYFVFGQKFVRVKDMTLQTNCNVGVNCKSPNDHSKCGLLGMSDAFFADGSQAVGDKVQCATDNASLFELFDNNASGCPHITLRQPPKQPWTTAILDDLDADGTPSCGSTCNPDYGDVEVGCGFPAVFPACGANDVIVQAPGDGCPGDTTAGNGRCDLAPGTYGSIIVRNQGKLNLAPGNYNVCAFKVGREAKVTGTGVNMFVADSGQVRAGGGSLVMQECGDLNIKVKGKGRVSFGRHVSIAAKICAPESRIRLGHSNDLRGQFIGDAVTSDLHNKGQCCGGRCTCIDTFSPSSAHVGDTITLTSACDLSNATAVRICGIASAITSQSSTEVKVTVPAGAAGACMIEVDSAVGSFKVNGTLTVN